MPTAGKRSKKKAAVKKAVPRGKGIVRAPDLQVPAVELPPGDRPTRLEVEMAYVTDRDRRSVEWWAQNVYTMFSPSTLVAWSQKFRWVEKRRDWWSQVEQLVAQGMATESVREQIDEIKRLKAIGDKLHRQMNDEDNEFTLRKAEKPGEEDVKIKVVPPTFEKREGAARVLLALDQRLDEKRKAILGAMPVALGTQQASGSPTSQTNMLSPEEARAVAHARLRVQQGKPALEAAREAAEGLVDGDEEDGEEKEGADG